MYFIHPLREEAEGQANDGTLMFQMFFEVRHDSESSTRAIGHNDVID